MSAASSSIAPLAVALSSATSTRRNPGGWSFARAAGRSGAVIAEPFLGLAVAADAEAVARLGEDDETILDKAIDRPFREGARGIAAAGGPSGQELDALIDGVDRVIAMRPAATASMTSRRSMR